jgi:hypothetical protein
MLAALPHEGNLAQAYAVARFDAGHVGVLVVSLADAISWNPAPGGTLFGGDRADLIRVADDGTATWSVEVASGDPLRPPVLAPGAAGEVVVGSGRQVRVFDDAGTVVRSATLGGEVFGVGSAPSGELLAYLVLEENEAAAYGLPPAPVGVLVRDATAAGATPLVVNDNPTFAAVMAVDELGTAWIGSTLTTANLHRVAADGSVSVIGIPEVHHVEARAGGGAFVHFLHRLGTDLDPALDGLEQGTYRVEVDAAGTLVGTPLRFASQDAVAGASTLGTLYAAFDYVADNSVLFAHHNLVLGDPQRRATVSSAGYVVPRAVLGTPTSLWVAGAFSGHVALFGEEIASGLAYGAPFVLRLDDLALLSEIGGGLPACGVSSDACVSCIDSCTSTNPCAFVEACAFAIGELARCLCRAPEESSACAATWNSDGDPKVDLLASCYAGQCQAACGL